MSQDPFSSRPQPPQMPQYPRFDDRPQSSTNWLWVVGIVGAVVFLGGLVCCGGMYGLVNVGMDVVAEDIRMQLQDHPTIQEHVGEMEEIETEFVASLAHEDDDTFVYEVSGSKGKGRLTVKSITDDEGREEIISATLRTDEGQTIELEL